MSPNKPPEEPPRQAENESPLDQAERDQSALVNETPAQQEPGEEHPPGRRAVLSIMAGGGVSSIAIVIIGYLNFTPNMTTVLTAGAAILGNVVGVLGPVATKMLVYWVRFQGWTFLLKRWKSLADSIPDDAPNRAHKAKVLANVRLAQQTLNDILRDGSNLFVRPKR